MPSATRKALTAALGCLALVTLAGCQPEPGPFTSGPVADLPSEFADEDIVDSSVRLLGSDSEGFTYFAAKKQDTSGEMSCVVILPADDDGYVICGGLPLAGSYKSVHVALSGMPVKEGADGETVGTFLQVTRSN